jgi:two-component system, cell cycle sensor histidine kinase and response regulator CckA
MLIARATLFVGLGGVVAIALLKQQRAALARKLATRLASEAPAETLALIAGGALHDVGNMLSAIHILVRLARQALPADAPAQDHLEAAERAADRATALLQHTLEYARGNSDARPLALDEVVRDAAALLRVALRPGIELELALGQAPRVRAPPGQMFRVVANLLLNAVQAIPAKGHVRFALDEAADPGGRSVRLLVEDDGSGIDPKYLPRIFDPFFTTKPGGTGLGLPAVASIVEAHGGAIEVASAPGKGTRFTLRFPPARAA